MTTPADHGGIIRTVKDANHPYVMISRALAQDKCLSFEARGLMTYLLSKPDNWEVQPADLQEQGTVGRDQLRRIMKELQTAGYMARYKEHINGRWRWVTLIYEVPQPSLVQSPENPSLVQSPENPSLVQGPEKQPPEKQATENTSIYIVQNGLNTEGQKREGAGAPDSFDALPRTLDIRAEREARAQAAAGASRPVDCPRLEQCPAPFRSEVIALLQANPHITSDQIQRQLAWYRQEKRREQRTLAEWVSALRDVVADEVDKWRPATPAPVRKVSGGAPIVANWD